MKKNDLISIVIPVYNAEKYLHECLESIVNQTYNNIEIILVNDGSKDSSKEICEYFVKKYKNIKFINQKNKGVSSARNEGIKKATGEYILFVDSDDYIDKNMIELLYNAIIDTDSELSICNVYGNKSFENIPSIIDRKTALDLILDKDKFRGYPVNKLYKSKYVKKILFNPNIRICEDLLFNCQYISMINKISIVNEYLYHYNRNENSAINNNKNLNKKTALEAYKNMIPIYEKNNIESKNKLYISLIKTYTDVLYNFYNAKVKFDDNKDIVFIKKIYRSLLKQEEIKTSLKAEAFIYYRFPIIIQKLRHLYYKINKNKR